MATGNPIIDFLMGFVSLVLSSDILTTLTLLVLSVAVAKIVHFVLEKYVSKITAATKTKLDDNLLEALKRPIYIFSLLIGIYLSILNLNALDAYRTAVNKTFLIALVLVATYTVVRLVITLLNWYEESVAEKTGQKIDEHFMPAIRKVISIFIYAIGFIVMMDQLGVKVTALIASLGVASLAVALALQETLSNFFAGLYIIADKPFKIGDFIKLETGEEGNVDNIGWRTTKIKIETGNILIIPNNKISSARILNYYLPMRDTNFTISCNVPNKTNLENVESVATKVAGIVQKKISKEKDHKPIVRFTNFNGENVELTVTFQANNIKEKADISHEYIKSLNSELKKRKLR